MTQWRRAAAGWRRPRTVTIGVHRVPVAAGAAIYEIDGRLLARTEDWTSGPDLERAEVAVLDGYPLP